MRLEDEATLSYYEELSKVNDRDDVSIVRHKGSGQLFVRKKKPISCAPLYRELSGLKHLGIPGIYHVIEDNESVIVIEEHINGITLSDYIENARDSGKTLSEKDAVEIACCLCDILEVLHGASPPIIHRDIKPQNVMIENSESGMQVTLIDFDASKHYDSRKTRDTVLMGTAEFAAPEQFGYGQSDARTDIYALGVLLNVMITGKLPRDTKAGGRIGGIIDRCTKLEPDERYESVSQLKSKLKSRERSWLPPGFRTGKPLKMVVGTLGYAFMIFSTWAMEPIENAGLWWTMLNKAVVFLSMAAMVVISFDYMGIASKLPLVRGGRVLDPGSETGKPTEPDSGNGRRLDMEHETGRLPELDSRAEDATDGEIKRIVRRKVIGAATEIATRILWICLVIVLLLAVLALTE